MSFRFSPTKPPVTLAKLRHILPNVPSLRPMTLSCRYDVKPCRIRTGLTLSILTISLTACQSVPNVNSQPVLAQPHIPVNQPYPIKDKQTSSHPKLPSIAAARWQDFYSDQRLKALIALGLKNNKDLENAILAIKKARAQYQITDIRDVPTINGNAGFDRAANNSVDKNPRNSYNVNLGMANYELDFWGKISSLKDQALQNYLATAAGKDAAQISLISNIAQSYANLSYSRAQLALAQATVDSRAQSLFIAQKRFEAGIDPKLPTLQAEASLENAKIAVYRAQKSIDTAINALQYLVGSPIPAALMPPPAVTNITNIQSVFNAGIPSELLRYRPDILQAEYTLKAAGANIDVARAAYFPSISLAGRVGAAGADLESLFKSAAIGWSFGPSVSVPIFDAGRLEANYDVAKVEQEQALNRYEKSIQTAFKEVADVLANRATLDQQLESQYKLQDNFDQTYQIAQARFRAGLSNYLDVLDAERSKFAAQKSILQLELAKLISQIELYQVLGGGANLAEGTVIPVPEHSNVANLFDPKSRSAKRMATRAIDAAGSARIADRQEVVEILKAKDPTVSGFKPTKIVDLDADGNADAAVGIYAEDILVDKLADGSDTTASP